jgi:hypothetical protein
VKLPSSKLTTIEFYFKINDESSARNEYYSYENIRYVNQSRRVYFSYRHSFIISSSSQQKKLKNYPQSFSPPIASLLSALDKIPVHLPIGCHRRSNLSSQFYRMNHQTTLWFSIRLILHQLWDEYQLSHIMLYKLNLDALQSHILE